MEAAARAIRSIFAAGFLPSALEIADAFTLSAVCKRTGSKLLAGCQAHLIVELDGQEKSVRAERRELEKVIRAAKPSFVQCASGSRECERLWQLRREFSYALRDTGLTKLNEDIVVPRGRLEELFRFAGELQRKFALPVACFGHAGDGNIHVNIMVDETASDASARRDAALDALFQKVLAMEGVITGEHGIGIAKKPWWPAATTPAVRDLHRAIKQALDPKGLLNPGKFLD
jgi:glycolate oxidase